MVLDDDSAMMLGRAVINFMEALALGVVAILFFTLLFWSIETVRMKIKLAKVNRGRKEFEKPLIYKNTRDMTDSELEYWIKLFKQELDGRGTR